MSTEVQEENRASCDAPSVVRQGKYLTFSLGNESYGIGILQIREIIEIMPVTAIPQVPDYIKGIINLRGKIIPIIDFRRKFNMPPTNQTDQTCIIVVDVTGRNGSLVVGLIVDSVSEVLNIREAEIEDSPAFGSEIDTHFILGIAKTESGVKILLDIDRVLNIQELQQAVNQA
jgi:purine-binding chemotaxis protein CheW